MAASIGRTHICQFVKRVSAKSSRNYVVELAQKRIKGATVGHNLTKVSTSSAIDVIDRQSPGLNRNFQRLNIRLYSSSTNTSNDTPDSFETNEDRTTDKTWSKQETLVEQSAESVVEEQDSTSDKLVDLDNETVIEASFSEETNETELVDRVEIPDATTEEIVLDRSDLPARFHEYTEEEKKLVQFEDIQDDLYLKIDLTVKSIDREVLRSYLKFLQMAALGFQIEFTTKRMPKYQVTKSSILKSVHIYKKHFHQYETRTHYLFCTIHKVTGSTASVFLEYIQRNLPEGMAMKVTKHKIEMLPEHLKPKIKAVETSRNEEN